MRCTDVTVSLTVNARGFRGPEPSAAGDGGPAVAVLGDSMIEAGVFDGDFVVTDIKIIHGPKGLFVSMPSKKRKDGTFKDIAHPLNNKMRQYLEEKVLAVYRQQVGAPASGGGGGTPAPPAEPAQNPPQQG